MRVYDIVGLTDKGAVRERNEDHILIGRFIKNRGCISMCLEQEDDYLACFGLVLAVADGIGGKAGGATASRLALFALEKQFCGVEKTGKGLDFFVEVIRSAVLRANETILTASRNQPELRGMGATLSGVCLTAQGYLVFNAGDSKVYRVRNGTIRPLTKEESVTAPAVDAGLMSEEEAAESPFRHTLTNCLGLESFHLSISPGNVLRDNETLLICSDGLHDFLSYEEMEEILVPSVDSDRAVRSLFEKAVAKGGHDNISIILIRHGLLGKMETPCSASHQEISGD